MTALPPVLVQQALWDLWHLPGLDFIRGLYIADLYNREHPFGDYWFEQLEYAKALSSFRRVVAVKPRQVGFTTVSTLWFLAKLLRADHPRILRQVVQDKDNLARVRRMVEVAVRNLPPELQFGLTLSNRFETEFAHNGARVERILAGARGQGRGGTVSDLVLTEMAFYPEGTNATKGSGAGDRADADLFSSLQATLHDPEGQIVVESTGDGPRGLFYDLAQSAVRGQDGVAFVFLPWTASPRYRRPVPPTWERTDEEQRLADRFGVDDEQLAFRRHKIEVERYSRTRFRREYPLTWDEPFLLDTATWFDPEATSVFAAAARPYLNRNETLEVYEEPRSGEAYVIGQDPSGGGGGDEGAICVLDLQGRQVARWASRTLSPFEQAKAAAMLSARYNRALVLCEANRGGFGDLIIRQLEEWGVPLWTNEDGGAYFATGANAGGQKREVMAYAREVVSRLECMPRDPETVRQLQNIVEKENGKIEARKREHDDRAIAFCLALWALRSHRIAPPKRVDAVAEQRRWMARVRQDHGLLLGGGE